MCALAVSVPAQSPRPFSAQDLVALERVSDPQLSPDGRMIAFVVRETNFEANKGLTGIWLLDLDSRASQPRRLTTSAANDSHPRWSSDGKYIYFLSSRTGIQQVWALPMTAGEARQVTRLPVDVGTFVISPTSAHLAVTLEVFPDCATVACTAERLAESEAEKATGRLYERLFVRHWDKWKDGRVSGLFVLPLDDGGIARGEPRFASEELDADVPARPFGGSEEITFTADGESLIFSAREKGNSEPWSTNFDLYEVAVTADEPARNLTADNPAWDAGPVVSPDGKWLAYRAMKRPGFESDRFRITLRNLTTGQARVLAEDWDRSPSSLAFSHDGRTLYAISNHLGQSVLWSIGVKGGAPHAATSDGYVSAVTTGPARVVFAKDDLHSPAQLFSLTTNRKNPVQLTQFNQGRLEQLKMGEFEQFTFRGWNEETVYAYVMKPAEFQPGRRYPVAFLIHGGPQGSFGNHFHYRWNPQTYAGAGYAAVFIDFHGSTGYGQSFTDSISGDWGGKPLEDLQKGLEAALARYPWLDDERICALGASYGGYMINWIAGNWPERFRCLVNHDGIFDNRMMYYGTEELWFPEWEHGGPYYIDPSAYEKHNPAHHVRKWRTPMLVIHGALDYRVPETQALATFTALQRQGIPSRFLYFPDENHWVLQPANSVLWHETVTAWLDRWLNP